MSEGCVRVGLLGCGVVGTGVVEVLRRKKVTLMARTGFDVRIERIAVCDVQRDRHSVVDIDVLTDKPLDICTDSNIDVVIEVMGGTDVAREAVMTALSHGKSVVTANKELVARYGDELRQLARQHEVQFRYEASALAGLPVIHPLQDYFTINRVESLRGIVNGTCNYILTRMHDDGLDMESALQVAQESGYAEREPSMDIDGHDANFKLDILLDTFGLDEFRRPTARQVEGIRHVTRSDVEQAKRDGKKLKHLVSVARHHETGAYICKVGVEAIAADDALYGIDGVENALNIQADIVGQLTFRGPGAGALPTASSVLEDLMAILRETAPGKSATPSTALKMV